MPTNLNSELGSLRIDRSARPEPSEPRWSRRYIKAGIIVLVVLAVIALVSRTVAGGATEVDMARTTAEPAGAAGVVLNATGYVVAHHKISVNSKVTGRVAWIGVEKGDRVKEGQILVRLEDDEFRANVLQARGALRAAEANLQQLLNGSRPEEILKSQADLDEGRATAANDKANLDRIRPLVEQGVFSRQQLDDAQARHNASSQRVNSLEKLYTLAKIGPRVEQIAAARGQVEQARGNLAYAESQLEATQIRAPVTGTILERTAEKGELVTAQFASTAEGGPRGSVVALADLNDIQVELDISQSDFARLSAKQKAVVTTDAFPDRKYDGVIAEISPEANRQKATVQVKVQVLNPDDYLKPDMNASVSFLSTDPQNSQRGGTYVPTSAVKDREGRKIVYAVVDGKVQIRPITILEPRSNGYLAEGVNGGDNVILNPPPTLEDGARVKPKGRS